MSRINLSIVMAFGTKIRDETDHIKKVRFTVYTYKNKFLAVATALDYPAIIRHDQNPAPEHIKRHKHLIRIKSDKCAPAKLWLKPSTTKIVEIAGRKYEINFKKEHINHNDFMYRASGQSQNALALRHLDRFRKSAAQATAHIQDKH